MPDDVRSASARPIMFYGNTAQVMILFLDEWLCLPELLAQHFLHRLGPLQDRRVLLQDHGLCKNFECVALNEKDRP